MKRKHRLTKLFIVLLIVLAPITCYLPVYASVPQPDSSPSLSNIHVNTYLLVSGDVLIYGEYNLPYSTIPSIPASQAFIFRLISTDNVTELGAVTPYVYFNYGYGYGAFSFYFTSLTWNQPYIIRISENPSQFASPVNFDFVMTSAEYSTKTAHADNQAEVDGNIVMIAHDMETHYPTYTLTQPAGSLVVLSAPYGETYFSNVIPGLQTMVPDLYLIQNIQPDLTTTNWTTTQFDTYENRFNGTWVGTSENATANQFGMTTGLVMSLALIVPLCIGAIILSAHMWGKAEAGFVACSILLIMGAVMGWLPKAIFASIFQAMGIFISYLWFYARA